MRQRVLRNIIIACVAVIVADVVISNVVVDDFSTLADFWWVLAVPIGLLLVGTIAIGAGVLLLKEQREARATGPASPMARELQA